MEKNYSYELTNSVLTVMVRTEFFYTTIDLCMYCMRTQIFIDGNKRASVIFVNHFMISHGLGLIVIPEKYVSEFKKKLVLYYEIADISEIRDFLKEKCWRKMKEGTY